MRAVALDHIESISCDRISIILPRVPPGENVHGLRPLNIYRAVSMYQVGICHVQRFLVGRKAQSIRPTKAIGNDSYIPRGWIEPIHLARQLRCITETLLVAIDRVGEPDAAVSVNHDVIDAGEASAALDGGVV